MFGRLFIVVCIIILVGYEYTEHVHRNAATKTLLSAHTKHHTIRLISGHGKDVAFWKVAQ